MYEQLQSELVLVQAVIEEVNIRHMEGSAQAIMASSLQHFTSFS